MNKWLIAIVIACACATLIAAPATAPIVASTTAPTTAPTKFMRFIADGRGGGRLEAGVARYENADGVSVDLVAAVHIADPSFYRALDASFDDYDAVLFERVQPKSTTQPTTRSFTMILASMSQMMLSGATGLEHQLKGIHYKDRKNFIHADMDLETFQNRQKERGETLFSGLRGARGRGPGDREAQRRQQEAAQEILLALVAPDRPRRMKLAMAKLFGELGDASFGDEAQPTVIIDERNRVALGVLKDVLEHQTDKRTIAIFYGAGHLKGMEKILLTEFGFHQVGPTMWRIAWQIDPPANQPSPTTQPMSK